MRATAVLLLAYLAITAADVVKVFAEDEAVPQMEVDEGFREDPQQQGAVVVVDQEPDGETLLFVDQGTSGGMHITGMVQSFKLDNTDINQLLSRPRASFLDVSWSNWVDQRMELLDMFQNLLSPIPRCPHMQSDRSTLDTGMVSYLASSRFGPAILTTYAQKFQEDMEDDFDYEEVYIPEGKSLGKSYEDASLLEDLSADADKAFQQAEQESRLLSQQQSVGFFGANIKSTADQAMYSAQLDGASESVQPNIRSTPPLKRSQFESFMHEEASDMDSGVNFQDYASMDAHQIAGMALFLVLCTGCIYVWASLLHSCCRMGRELKEQRRARKESAQKAAQAELLAPLMPEGAKEFREIEYAQAHAPHGTYYAPQGEQYITVAVPLVNGQAL